jgi:formiminoglutamase
VDDKEPDDTLRTLLIETYYLPYHRSIQKSLKELDLQLCLDCHSMASYAPSISPDGNNNKRPMFCLSNNDGQTSSQEMLELLADSISESFSVDRGEISLNDPFHGGHITQTYGNNPIPWIQVEMNRDLYLSPPWFDEKILSVDTNHLQKLNKQFKNSLELLFSKI